MKILRLTLLILISLALGFTFLVSAFTKSEPTILKFEYTIVEFVRFPWMLAAISARLLVGIEYALGTLLIFNIFGKKKWVLKLSILTLVIFSLYLVYLWISAGNDVNCGCFGDKYSMSPGESLLKNVAMLLLLFILHKWHSGITAKPKLINILAILALTGITTVPFFREPIKNTTPVFLNDDKVKIDLSALYDKDKKDPPSIDLTKGKHIISFMSLTCPHCRMAAYKMQLMKEKNPDLSIYIVLNGDSSNLAPFWEETKAEHIPHTMLLGRDFAILAGSRLPAIYWLEDGYVVSSTNYIDLEQSSIEKWMFSTENTTEHTD